MKHDRGHRRISHNHNVICDICGRKKKWSETTLAYGTGDVAVVVSCLDGCADYRHPLNSAPPVIFDAPPVPDARPDVTANNKETFIPEIIPSYMYWGTFTNAGLWGTLNNPNNEFNYNGLWLWGSFLKR